MSMVWNEETNGKTMGDIVVGKIPVGVAVLDEGYRFVYCNDALCQLFDLITNNLVGKRFDEVFGMPGEAKDDPDGEIGDLMKSVEHAFRSGQENPRHSGFIRKAYVLNGDFVERRIRYTVEKMGYQSKAYCLMTLDDLNVK